MNNQHTPGPWVILGRNTVYGANQPLGDNPQEFRKIIVPGVETARRASELGGFATVEEYDANARLIAAAPDLLLAAKCALADLEGILPEFEPSGERQHPGWQTIEDLRKAIARASEPGETHAAR